MYVERRKTIPLSQPFPPREKGVENFLVPSPLGGGLGRGIKELDHPCY